MPDVREWCDWAFDRFRDALDADFDVRFRRETPKRFSELFFAAAFDAAGWQPIDRVKGFDLSFGLPDGGRLLVEITTPEPQLSDSWDEEQRGKATIYSMDTASVDAALLRITSGFASKAGLIKSAIENGADLSRDYKVVAISGLQVTQETPVLLSTSGPVPDFARAFLPIGDKYIRVLMGPGSDDRPINSGYSYSASIEKSGGSVVERSAFTSDLFAHVDAVAFSPMLVPGLDRARLQVGVLHNPFSTWPGGRLELRMGNEYFVRLHDDEFELQRLTDPDAMELERSDGEGELGVSGGSAECAAPSPSQDRE